MHFLSNFQRLLWMLTFPILTQHWQQLRKSAGGIVNRYQLLWTAILGISIEMLWKVHT